MICAKYRIQYASQTADKRATFPNSPRRIAIPFRISSLGMSCNRQWQYRKLNCTYGTVFVSSKPTKGPPINQKSAVSRIFISLTVNEV